MLIFKAQMLTRPPARATATTRAGATAPRGRPKVAAAAVRAVALRATMGLQKVQPMVMAQTVAQSKSRAI